MDESLGADTSGCGGFCVCGGCSDGIVLEEGGLRKMRIDDLISKVWWSLRRE
jgi:hypothetical protein